jgi:oxaloacetate decarboxylase alpha subunit
VGDFVSLHLRSHELGEVVRLLDKVGFAAVDGFGGGSAERVVHLLREDPWERLRVIRRGLANTPLQVVLRSKLLFGSSPAPLSTIRATLRLLSDLGVDHIKVSDPGIDIEGARMVVEMAKFTGFKVTAAVPVAWGLMQDPRDALLEAGATFTDAGADEIALQDPFGLLSPAHLASLVRSFTQHCSLPLRLHVHDTSLMSAAAIEAGVSAGAAFADATISSLAWTYSPPRAESLLMALRGSRRAPAIDLTALENVSRWFDEAKERKGFGHKVLHGVDHALLRGEMPSTVKRTLAHELMRRERSDLLPRAWEEAPKVWESLGCPPLLTPLLEVVCAQTAENVCNDVPFSSLTPRTVTYLRGVYGQPRHAIRSDLITRARDKSLESEAPLQDIDHADFGPSATVAEKLTKILFGDGDSLDLLKTAKSAEDSRSEMPADSRIPRKVIVEHQGESFEVNLEGLGPMKGNKRTLFMRIGAETSSIEVAFPPADSGPEFVLKHHGKSHRIKILEILPKGKRTLPVVMRKDGQVVEILYSFPKNI